MKKCPFCQAPNNAEALVCYRCGRTFVHDAAPVDPSPTQPLRPRPVQPGWGQQRPPDATAPYPQAGNQPAPQDPYPPDPTQPFPGKAYQQPSRRSIYFDRYPETNSPLYDQPVFVPPTPTALPRDDHFSLWTLLIIGLSLVLMTVCGLAFYTLTSASANRAAGLRTQVSTQVGQVFGSAGSNNQEPAGVSPTTAPTPSPTLAPTQQVAITDNLLTPECKGSLEYLGEVSGQAKSDPLIVLKDTWRMNLNRATADLQIHCGSLESASPIPGEIDQVRESIKQANSEFDQANQLWNQTFDQRDPSKALGAAQHLGEATKYLGQAIDQLHRLTR